MNRREYRWAVPRDELAGEIGNAIEAYYAWTEDSGRLELWRRAIRMSEGLDAYGETDSSTITSVGEVGEALAVRANHFGSLCEHTTTLTSADRPAIKARALTADPEAAEHVQLAEALADYELDERGLEDQDVEATRYAVVMSEAWTFVGWNPNAGDVYSTTTEVELDDNGEPVLDEDGSPQTYEKVVRVGDIDVETFMPIDVIRDTTRRGSNAFKHDWVLLRRRINKFDLAARYAEYEDDILGLASDEQGGEKFLWEPSWKKDVSDEVSYFELFHRSTPSLPEGRHAVAIHGKVLEDGPLPYEPSEQLPVFPRVPLKQIGRPHGYARAWDLLGLSEALDSVVSTMLSNEDAFSGNVIVAGPGATIDPNDTVAGFSLVRCQDPSQVKVLELKGSHDSSIKFAELLVDYLEAISGINSVARGNPQASLKSGVSLALVHAQALEFLSALQNARARSLEKVLSAVIERYKQFATVERTVEITGKDKESQVRTFKADNLRKVRRIRCELASPLFRNTAGRAQVAENLLTNGAVKPEGYLSFIRDGRLEDFSDPSLAQKVLINRENEVLRKGGEAPVMRTDDHLAHVASHLAELNSPDSRLDPTVAQRILDHISEHEAWIHTYRTGQRDVIELVLSGQVQLAQMVSQVPPPPAMPLAQVPLPGGPGGPPPGPSMSPSPSNVQVGPPGTSSQPPGPGGPPAIPPARPGAAPLPPPGVTDPSYQP